MFSYSAVLILLPSIGRRKKKKTVNRTSSILDKGDKIIYELGTNTWKFVITHGRGKNENMKEDHFGKIMIL